MYGSFASIADVRALSVPRNDARCSAVHGWVEAQVKAVARLDGSTTIDRRAPLDAIGIDSLLAVELRDRLERAAGFGLPRDLLGELPTLDALVGHLVRGLTGGLDATS